MFAFPGTQGFSSQVAHSEEFIPPAEFSLFLLFNTHITQATEMFEHPCQGLGGVSATDSETAQMSPLQILLMEHCQKLLIPSPQADSFVLNHW